MDVVEVDMQDMEEHMVNEEMERKCMDNEYKNKDYMVKLKRDLIKMLVVIEKLQMQW